jgi:Protein of unknown function (DUF2911)
MRSLLLPILLATPFTVALVAQDKPAPVRLMPLRPSPASTLSQEIGISRIEISFSRPGVKGRKIWGGVVPFGEVWRTGANAATVITFSHPAKVAGKNVPAGSYGFFAIPGEKAWTLILSTRAKQSGSSDYKQQEDLLRWEVTPETGPFLERLDYRVLPVDAGNATVELGWEKLRVSFPVAFDTRAIYWAHLEDKLKQAPDTDWVPWYQAARYCQEQSLDPQKAQAWIEKSLRIHEDFLNQDLAARIYREAKRMPEALAHLQKAIDLSRGKAPKEYTENLEREWAAWKATN